MLFKLKSREERALRVSSVKPAETVACTVDSKHVSESELRRSMYERIAEGNALAEAEETASRKWRGK